MREFSRPGSRMQTTVRNRTVIGMLGGGDKGSQHEDSAWQRLAATLEQLVNDHHKARDRRRARVRHGDGRELAPAQGQVAKARGMTRIAKDTGTGRASL